MKVSSRLFAPVFNAPDLDIYYGQRIVESEKKYSSLKLDEWGQIDEVACHVFPREILSVKERIYNEVLGRDVYRVIGDNQFYQSEKTSYYVDSVFFELDDGENLGRFPLLSKEEVLANLQGFASSNASYIWGGMNSGGCPMILDKYVFDFATDLEMKKAIGAGFDCSGLIYSAHRNPSAPRNTSQMVVAGSSIDIEGRSFDEILSMIQPLDIIVWRGHVLIFLKDDGTCVDSRWDGPDLSGGVRISSFDQVVSYLNSLGRFPVNEFDASNLKTGFVIKRDVYRYK